MCRAGRRETGRRRPTCLRASGAADSCGKVSGTGCETSPGPGPPPPSSHLCAGGFFREEKKKKSQRATGPHTQTNFWSTKLIVIDVLGILISSPDLRCPEESHFSINDCTMVLEIRSSSERNDESISRSCTACRYE